MIESFKAFLGREENLKLFIIITSFVILFAILVIVLLIFNVKKKKYRKSLDTLRTRIQRLKQHEVIKNYGSYDNLKSDPKLGMLVLRWKKEIEKLVREIDAQYSMLDVLEDAIDQNNYQYFLGLKNAFNKDVGELEEKADKFKDEIIEYIDMASDNRKYIHKYHDMVAELKVKYKSNISSYEGNKVRVEKYFKEIEDNFLECQNFIEHSQFSEADNIASNIFKEIKVLENYINNSPKILERVNTVILPKFSELKKLSERFTDDDFKIMKMNFNIQYNIFNGELEKLIEEVNSFKIDDFEIKLKEIEEFLVTYNKKLDIEQENKQFIIKNLIMLQDNISKIEVTAKNFNSIFKIVQGSYNITANDIHTIAEILTNIEHITARLSSLDKQFETHEVAYDEIKSQIEFVAIEITKISKELDSHLNIIDEIYQDEKTAREQISTMTEKINGTKKYIKYANLDEQNRYLNIIKQLNLEVSNLYMLLNTFPIDIVQLNDMLKVLVNKVDKTTQDINGILYKILLSEFCIMYANRYFSNMEFQKELLIAENLFYKKSYTRAYEKIMNVLDTINPDEKKFVLDKYQLKFGEIFK